MFYKISQQCEEYAETPETYLIPQEIFGTIRSVLQQRIDETPPASKKHEMHKRQYEVFLNLVFKLYENIPEDEAIQTLVQEFHLKEWTIKRDIKDVREFLKNVLE